MCSNPATTFRVTFEPTGRSVHVLTGTTVLEAASRCGLTIDAPCGGTGQCGKCLVRFTADPPKPTDSDRRHCSEEKLQAGWRLACEARLTREAVVSIPETSLFTDRLQILTESESIVERSGGEPPHQRVPLEIVDGEENLAVAFDIGTTTLVGELVNLPDGHSRAVAATINPQVSFGDDVVSRIGRACESPETARELRDAVRGGIESLLAELCDKAGVRPDVIRGVSFAGNTTMQHLLCGWDVAGLSQLPFEPLRRDALDIPAGELGLALPDSARAYVMPVIGGFVGGDTVAGIVSTRLCETHESTLMVDIGTNGELVLCAGGKAWSASCAAGPAFEGARISSGMRAAAGAIEKVVFDGDLQYSVIGGGEPIGICGSALVDLAAELLRTGGMEPVGRIADTDELADLPTELQGRFRRDGQGQMEFLLAERDGGDDVTLRQRDIRELQLSTGAIRAGVSILLKLAGIKAEDLSSVLIAGGFGSFIRRSNAQRIGLIPPSVPAERIRYVGNVSLHGAKWALVSAAARAQAEGILEKVTHVELSNDPEFQMEFAEAMIFPDGEGS